MALLCNALLPLITFPLFVSLFRQKGRWRLGAGLYSLRFFTVQSNLLCAVAGLCRCMATGAAWSWWLKYLGTAALAVTMLTVLCFLGPAMGYRPLLTGRDFFYHLLNPLLALSSFLLWERRGLSLPLALTGVAPVAVYGAVYIKKVLFSPENRRWEDFYGFNRHGRWKLSLVLMLGAAALLCLVLAGGQNL